MEESCMEKTLYVNKKKKAPCPQANQAEIPLLHC